LDSSGNNFVFEEDCQGSIRVSDEVVTIIAGLAASEVEGVAGMSGGITGGLAEKLGRKNLSKGIKAEVSEKEAIIDISVIVDYGAHIHEVARKIQNSVKGAVEKMTGLKVMQVNINVQGVSFSQEQ